MARRPQPAVQQEDSPQARAHHRVAPAVLEGAGAGRPDRGRVGGADGDPAVARVLEHRGAAAAARALRQLCGVLRVHRAGRVPRGARGAHGHRVAAHVAGGRRGYREGGAAHLPGGAGHAAHGRARARLPRQLRLGAGLLGVHVRRGAHDRHLAGQGPVRHLRHRPHLPAAVDIHLQQPPRRLPMGPHTGIHLYCPSTYDEENRHGEAGRAARGRPHDAAEGAHQVHVDAGHLPQRARRGGGRRARRGARGPRRPALPAHGSHPGRRAARAAAAVRVHARRQLVGRLPGHGVGAGLRHRGDPADRAAGGPGHLQGVLGGAHHRRHAGDAGAGRGGRVQRLRAGLPGRRLPRALRRRARLRRQDHLQRVLHGCDGDPGAAVLHAVLRVHPEGDAGGRHHLRHPVHGRVQRRQADVARQEAGSDSGHRHVHPVPDAAHRAGHLDRRRGQHHLHPVPRGAPQALRRDAQDGGRRGVPDDHAGPVPDVPVGGLRAAAGDQVRGGRRRARARGAGLHAHLQRRLHRRHQHRPAHRRLPRAPPAALLLQRQAERVLHLRGGRQAGPLRRLLRGRRARPAAGRRRAAAARQGGAAPGLIPSHLTRYTHVLVDVHLARSGEPKAVRAVIEGRGPCGPAAM